MLDIATSGYAELGPPPFALSLAAALSHLLDAVLRSAEPGRWTPMALEQLGELSLGIEPPEPQGIDHLAAAAQGFEDSQRPDDAARVWCRLMRWHAARAGGGAGVDDPAAEAEASLAAGARALQLSAALPPERVLVVVDAMAGTAWRMPGDGRATHDIMRDTIELCLSVNRSACRETPQILDQAVERLRRDLARRVTRP